MQVIASGEKVASTKNQLHFSFRLQDIVLGNLTSKFSNTHFYDFRVLEWNFGNTRSNK